MFSNFIYFIIVLLIYSTYQPSPEKNLPAIASWSIFLGITIAFFYYTRSRFKRLEKSLFYTSPMLIDRRFTALQTRYCILAIGIFAFHIYLLNLPDFFFDTAIFRISPTLLALLFLSVFMFYLAIIWGGSHRIYQKLYNSNLSRRSYIFSNVSFSIPVLLPWTLLAGVADLLNVLPFQWPKDFLSTTFGQACYFVSFLLIVAVFGPVMIQTFWRCKPLEQGFYRQRIEAMCKKAELSYSNILYWPIFGGRMITAGVMGLVGRFRYILVTNGLIRLLMPEEIDAVIAHEIGHVKRRHLLFYLLFFIGYPIIYYALYQPIELLISFVGRPAGMLGKLGMNSAVASVSFFNLLMIAIFLVYFRFIFGYFMRNFERQADAYVYTLLDSAKPLISTFQKIATNSAQPVDKPNWHHFSIKQRIDFLSDCESDRSRITRHNRKVRNSILIYLVVIIGIGIAGYRLNYGNSQGRLSVYIWEHALLNAISGHPDNPDLYTAIGMIYYEQKKYPQAIEAFEKSLQLLPDQDETLNSLSWLYATCDIPSYRNPQRALLLAKKAAELNASAHILDTLAESYFVNGMIEKAIEVELKAIEIADDRDYYEAQLQKFRQALN